MKFWIIPTLFAVTVAWGQEPDINPALEAFLRAQQAQQNALQMRKEEERKRNLPTIKQNAADYESDDPEIRRRAVLILGKYSQDPLALMVLKKALKDSEASVRQAALVALADPPIDKITANSMLLLLTDPDVSIRRICSATLPMLMQLYRGGAVSVVDGKVVRPPLAMDDHLKKRLLAAHRDEDETVRKNMVDVWPYLLSLVDEETFKLMLSDKSRDVRISALDRGMQVVGLDAFYQAIQTLVNDKDKLVRLRLAGVFSTAVASDAIGPLSILAKDADFDVSTAALVGLVNKGRADAWKALKPRFSDGRLKTETATKAIGYLDRLGAEGRDELIAFAQHNRTAFRAAAAKTLMRSSTPVGPDVILKLVGDSDSEVRQAGSQLVLRNRQLAVEHSSKFAESTYADIRQLAVTLSVYLKPDEREEVLLDLFLDNNLEVRLAALRRIATLRVKGWQQLITDALDDDEPDVQRAAVDMLLSFPVPMGAPESANIGRQVLDNYLNKGTDQQLKAYIQAELARRNPPPRRVPPVIPRPQ